MEVEKKLQTIINEANRHVALRPQEKETIRANVMVFMKVNPLSFTPAKPVQVSFLSWAHMVLRAPIVRHGSLAVLAMVVFSAGTLSVAAQYALPGDSLYQVKVGVNEKVLSFITFSDERRAEYEVHLAQKRLEEMEIVVAANSENDDTASQVKKLLDGHIASATAHAERISQEKQSEVSAKIHSEIEASLQAHGKVLGALTEGKGKPEKQKQEIKKFVSGLKASTGQATRAREKDEQELSSYDSDGRPDGVKESAENRLEAASHQIESFIKFVEEGNVALDADAAIEAQLAIENAGLFVEQGKTKIATGGYGSAFADFQQAMRIIQEARIHIAAEKHFNITIPLKGNVDNIIN